MLIVFIVYGEMDLFVKVFSLSLLLDTVISANEHKLHHVLTSVCECV